MYIAKLINEVKEGWGNQEVGVFNSQTNEQVGSFKRNYSSFGVETFCAFERNGKWYALYSPDYTEIRVMSLPDCKDIGGIDDADGSGFCPVEIYIPCYKHYLYKFDFTNKDGTKNPCEGDIMLFEDPVTGIMDESEDGELKDKPRMYTDYAFAAGCVWGDDSSWKVVLLDISQAHEGKVKMDWDWYGWFELPSNISLRQAIDINEDYATLATRTSLNPYHKITKDGGKLKLTKDEIKLNPWKCNGAYEYTLQFGDKDHLLRRMVECDDENESMECFKKFRNKIRKDKKEWEERKKKDI